MAKMTIREVGRVCAREGMGYAIQHYMSSRRIEDEQLAKLWQEADEALTKVNDFLTEHLGEGWDEE